MAVYKLQIDDFVTIDYVLIAIHASIEDYRLAYFINRNLNILLEKSNKDITVKSTKIESCFSRFTFEDAATDTAWNFVQNKSDEVITQQQSVPSLFSETGLDIAISSYLLPELKKVDYILKVENNPSFFMPDVVVNKLLSIKHITTAYTIDYNKLKSKNNLIF